LAEVGGERVGDGAVLAHPRERAAGVETAGERDADALAHGQRAEDDAVLPEGVEAHAAPSSRIERISEASSAPAVGSAAASSRVFSPAIVPAMGGWRPRSIAWASGLA